MVVVSPCKGKSVSSISRFSHLHDFIFFYSFALTGRLNRINPNTRGVPLRSAPGYALVGLSARPWIVSSLEHPSGTP